MINQYIQNEKLILTYHLGPTPSDTAIKNTGIFEDYDVKGGDLYQNVYIKLIRQLGLPPFLSSLHKTAIHFMHVSEGTMCHRVCRNRPDLSKFIQDYYQSE